MILDTSFLIDVMNGGAAALETVDEIEAAEVPQRIPAMTLQELYIGVGMSELPKQEQREIERIIEARPVVPTSAAIARKAGRIDGELRAAGEPIDIGDATIGATAVVCDEPVVTGNPDHFERISGIEVVSY